MSTQADQTYHDFWVAAATAAPVIALAYTAFVPALTDQLVAELGNLGKSDRGAPGVRYGRGVIKGALGLGYGAQTLAFMVAMIQLAGGSEMGPSSRTIVISLEVLGIAFPVIWTVLAALDRLPKQAEAGMNGSDMATGSTPVARTGGGLGAAISAQLETERRQAGVGFSALAELAGIPENALRGYESGQGEPSYDDLRSLSAVYQLSVSGLIAKAERRLSDH